MTANPMIDQLAAEVRRRQASRSAAVRRQSRNDANREADEFRRDLPYVPDEVLGAVLLRAAVYAGAIWQTRHGSTAREVSDALAAAGERLYHHAQVRDAPASDESGEP